MKSLRMIVAVFTVLAATFSYAQSDAQKSFDKLRTLAGSWQGKASDGMAVQVFFRETSNGSALMSEISGHEDMISMFHMDGDRLMMTHYCGAGNQPRMVGKMSPDGKSITFDFLDATNVLPSQPGHMEHLVINLSDPTHHTESWEFAANGGQKMHEVFDLQRVK
jgi:hypothetical protein